MLFRAHLAERLLTALDEARSWLGIMTATYEDVCGAILGDDDLKRDRRWLTAAAAELARSSVRVQASRALHTEDFDRPYKESAVTISTTCKGCGRELTATDEDELVDAVRAHVADVHAAGHTPSREQILAVIRARGARES